MQRIRATPTGVFGRGRVDGDGSGSLDASERAADLVTTAGRAALDLRCDRYVGERSSIYGLVGGLIDPFAGYDARTHEQLGVSRGFVATKTTTLVGELGFDGGGDAGAH